MKVQGDPCDPPQHLSPSSISTWQQCPLRFRYSRLDKLPEPSTQPQLLGSFVHEVLEHLYLEPAESRTVSEARQITSRLWNDKWADEVSVLGLNEEQLHKFRWQSWWCVEALWAMEDPQKMELGGVEQPLDMMVGDAKLLGILDRYHVNDDGKVVISDYKTGKKPKPRYEGEKRFQLTVYADLVQQKLNQTVDFAELLYLKEGVRWQISPTAQDIEEMRNTVQTVWSEVLYSCSSGAFEARRTILCDWCHYKSHCPAHQ